MPLTQEQWLDVGMDFAFVTPSNASDPKQSAFKIPSKSGPDSFFVYVDYATRYTEAVPMRSTDSAEDIYAILFSQIWTRYGQPCRIVSDRDGRFLSKWWQNRLKSLGIKIAMSAPYHPQTDGLAESRVKAISAALRALMNAENAPQQNWPEYLGFAAWAANTTKSETTGATPAELLFGFNPAMVGGLRSTPPLETQAQYDARCEAALDAARTSVQTSQQYQNTPPPPIYAVGDKVLLSTAHLDGMKTG